jgi:hypothetical protein
MAPNVPSNVSWCVAWTVPGILRYRWPDDFRDKVLARLWELSRKRAEE